jgi:hypothetical protein
MPKVTIEAEDDAAIERITNSVMTKTRPEGEKILTASACLGSSRATWIYLPQGNTWYDIGISSLKQKSKKSSKFLIFYPYNIEDVDEVTHYNVHTKDNELQFCNNLKSPTETVRKIIGHLAAVENSLPSPHYVSVYAMSVQVNMPAKYDFRIVHPRGITFFEFTDDNLQKAVDRYTSLFNTTTITLNVQKTVRDKKNVNGSIEDVVSYLNEEMNDSANIKFFPFKRDFLEDDNNAYGSKPYLN